MLPQPPSVTIQSDDAVAISGLAIELEKGPSASASRLPHARTPAAIPATRAALSHPHRRTAASASNRPDLPRVRAIENSTGTHLIRCTRPIAAKKAPQSREQYV